MSSHASSTHASTPAAHSGHVVPVSLYLMIFTALLVLTAATVAVAFVDLGAWSDVVALGIAVTKATLVVLYFMHLRYSTALNRIAVVTGILFLLVLIAFTLSDTLSRHLLAAVTPGGE